MTILEKAAIECGFKNEEYRLALPDSVLKNTKENRRILDESHTDLYETLIKLMSAFRLGNIEEEQIQQKEFQVLYCYYEDY